MLTQPNVRRIQVRKVRGGHSAMEKDALAVEEPLEIRLASDAGITQVAVTMRTPGEDFELAAGFLYSEGVLPSRDVVHEIRYCDEPSTAVAGAAAPSGSAGFNIVTVHLRPGATFDAARVQRNFYTTSSCGVCGKASLEALELRGCAPLDPAGPIVGAAVLRTLDAQLRRHQTIFDKTGGLHAAALFDTAGQFLSAHEDVGRHNALDKLIGRHVLDGRLASLRERILMVSGRTSFEIMQKTLMARIPIVVAVGAPSSLAVEVAQQFCITLIGFARGDGFNVYAGHQRVLT